MPQNQYGDNYEEDQYNGDPSYGGRVRTNKEDAEEHGRDWMEDMFVNEVLPLLLPELTNLQETFSDPTEVGEYKMDSDSDSEGHSTFMCEVAVSPERYSQLEQDGWKQISEEFKKAAVSFGSDIYSNDDNPETPTVTFSITVY